MFQKVFEYAGPHKKGLYAATAIVLVSVLLGVFPFVLAYQVIAPLVMGEAITASFIIQHVILVLVCLVLQALFYGWGLNLSHKAAYDTLLRLRTALQKRFEKLPLGVIQDKGTGTVKKLFVDDVDSLEVLLAHSMPEGIANLMVPIAVYVAMFFVDWKLALLSLASIPLSLVAMMTLCIPSGISRSECCIPCEEYPLRFHGPAAARHRTRSRASIAGFPYAPGRNPGVSTPPRRRTPDV